MISFRKISQTYPVLGSRAASTGGRICTYLFSEFSPIRMGGCSLKPLRSRMWKPHNSRQQVGRLDTGSIGDKAAVVTAFISPAAEHLAEKLEPRSEEHTSELQSPKE